ncbi:MAG TPA: copper amine oxidase N-terminal domain-containing protein, partial [Fimbriimonas sp.]|nr:copper amine oxidase N-terminal domain-containing protein [Fimbriimonas sp.]
MKNLQSYSLALVMASMAAAPAASYAIDVEINGTRVAFTDAVPMKISGRVMVPLRPVLEAMQINVEYDPVRREVTASEATKQVVVRLGSRQATANGRIMTLDVPAQELNGRTYIPLRFFGEALGAVIDWNETMQLVSITGRFGVGTGSTTGTGNIVSALSLDSEAKPWFVGGETVKFSLQSDPGLTPTLYLNGGNTLIPMREVASGRYVAEYVIPKSSSSKIAFLDDTPFAILMSNGKQVVVPLKQQIALDNTAPLISNVEPNSTTPMMVGRPVIGASLSDAGGSGIDPTSVSIMVDGKDVTNNAAVT